MGNPIVRSAEIRDAPKVSTTRAKARVKQIKWNITDLAQQISQSVALLFEFKNAVSSSSQPRNLMTELNEQIKALENQGKELEQFNAKIEALLPELMTLVGREETCPTARAENQMTDFQMALVNLNNLLRRHMGDEDAGELNAQLATIRQVRCMSEAFQVACDDAVAKVSEIFPAFGEAYRYTPSNVVRADESSRDLLCASTRLAILSTGLFRTQRHSLDLTMRAASAEITAESLLNQLESIAAQTLAFKSNQESLSELSETGSVRLQMAMDRVSKMVQILSNLLKRTSDVAQVCSSPPPTR